MEDLGSAMRSNEPQFSAAADLSEALIMRRMMTAIIRDMLRACCSTACPSYWWNADRFLGPAMLLQA